MPARMVSSVLMASTLPCWSSTRQSACWVTGTASGRGSGRALMLSMLVDPAAAHTLLPARSAIDAVVVSSTRPGGGGRGGGSGRSLMLSMLVAPAAAHTLLPARSAIDAVVVSSTRTRRRWLEVKY